MSSGASSPKRDEIFLTKRTCSAEQGQESQRECRRLCLPACFRAGRCDTVEDDCPPLMKSLPIQPLLLLVYHLGLVMLGNCGFLPLY